MGTDSGGRQQRGTIGEEIYERVRRLVGDEGLSRSEAFARISKESGRRAATVAANYYRVARRRGEGRPSGIRKAAATRKPPSSASGVGASAALARATAALRELEVVVRAQESELAALRAQVAGLDKIRSALRDL